MACPSSPTKEMLLRSRLHFEETLSSRILQQESLHALSKRPRRTRFAVETDSKLQNISETVLQIRKRVMTIHADMKNLEAKINRLDVIKEQACFFMTPKRILNSALGRRSSPLKLTYCSPVPAESFSAPTQLKLVEFLRRRKTVAIHLTKISERLGTEKRLLEDIFESNISILRFKRAEKSLIKMIKVQSRLKIVGKEFEGLEERLFSEDSVSDDSGFNDSY